MTKYLYKVERERVATDWWYVEAHDEKEAKTKAFASGVRIMVTQKGKNYE